MRNKINFYIEVMNSRTSLIQKIHESKYKITYVSSGGGTNAISSFLKVPGASNTILESYIPYSKKSMNLFLNKKPDHYCSLNTCLSMSANAYKKCMQIEQGFNTKYLIGVAVTASLATTYKKLVIISFILLFKPIHIQKVFHVYWKKIRDLEKKRKSL